MVHRSAVTGLVALLALMLVAVPASAALNGYSRFTVRYPDAGAPAWPPLSGECLTVEFGDTQVADHYHWVFGDGTTLDTISSLVDHTYTVEAQYPVNVTVYATADSGNSTLYSMSVNTVSGSCSVQAFLLTYLVIPLAIIAALFAILAISFGRKPYRRYRVHMVAGFVLTMLVLIAILLWTHALGV